MRIKIRCICVLFLAASGLLIVRADAQNPGQKPVLTPAVQEHLKEIAESLPPDSVVRYGLEHGGHGDGVRLPWMDEMRQMGIKRVVVQTEFLWHRRPKDAKAIYFVYSSTYDGDCGQIVDSQRLAKIRSSGLEAELGGEAVRRTFEVPWLRGKPRRVKHGFGIFTFLNDPWMPVVPRLGYLVSAPKRPVDPFLVAVDMGDVAAVKQFLREGVTAEERDEAVWALVAPTGTSCTLKALLQAGADPNMRDSYGSPLLMEEIRRGNVENAQVLVEAGADVNAKNHYGYTILSMAEAKPGFSGQDELVRLLKAAGARK